MSDVVMVTDLSCVVCASPVGHGCVITAATVFGTIGFCDTCWSHIYQAIYDDLSASGQIKQQEEE